MSIEKLINRLLRVRREAPRRNPIWRRGAVCGAVACGVFVGCGDEGNEEKLDATGLVAQTLLEANFDDGLWPGSFTQPSCATVRTRCEEGEFDPEVTYGAGDVVATEGQLYQCADAAFCSESGYEPGAGAHWSEAWNKTGACTPDGYAARLVNTCEVETSTPISTVGYQNVAISYEYRTTYYESSETVTVSYSLDGAKWEVASVHLPDPAWSQVSLPLPAEAANASTLHVRIATSANGDGDGNEAAFIDSIAVTGEAPAGCDPIEICSGASAACGAYEHATCGTVVCGNCATGEVCSASQCAADCSPAAICGSSECGTVDTTACGEVACGTCDGTDVCVESGCFDECSPEAVCAANGAQCGTVHDAACDVDVECGECASGTGCTDNQCAQCEGMTCAELGAECGAVANECGMLDCGLCGSGEICDGSNQCAPDTCTDCGVLSASDIAALESYIDCEKQCSYGKAALYDECVGDGSVENYGCGPREARWDKNRDGAVDELDRELAVLEAAHDPTSNPTICIENGAVVPIDACGLSDCEASHTASECKDKDGDGLRAFQEALIGTSDDPSANSLQTACGVDAPCGSFAETCGYVVEVNRKICRTRPECEDLAPGTFGGTCTAFHLEEVAQDADEVIVRVFYDHSPIPAHVLDLNVTYDDGTLVLADARPIGGLPAAGKQLDARHVSDGKLRLTVLGSTSTAPIPTGPLAELVFVRLSSAQSTLGFSISDYDQTWSIAPDQGDATSDLKIDSIWGGEAGDASGRVRQVNVVGSDANSDRLLIHYSFDNPVKPLDVSRAPSGDDLCELAPNGDCLDADGVAALEGPAREKAESDRVVDVARFDAMQRGVVQAERRIDGISGPAVFLDGVSNHLELPITLSRTQAQPGDDPLITPGDQSLTVSLWFYSEGDGNPGERQLLWSHNNPSSEKTQYSLTVNPGDAGTFALEWVTGDIQESGNVSTIMAGLSTLRWYNVAVSFDAAAGEADFYVDGNLAKSVSGMSVLSCPQTRGPSEGGIYVHEEGDLVGINGTKPEQIFFTSAENGLYGIEKMDPNGLARQEVHRTGTSSAPDVHYNPGLDKIVFSSSETGNTEIWIANGDGSAARQVTFGFGDTERKIFARRPRWVPGGSGVVFESNTYGGDDNPARTYRLFHLKYDNTKNEFAIPGAADDQVLTSLDYGEALGSQVIGKYALTASGVNSSNAQFVRKPAAGEDGGEVWFTESNSDWSNPRAGRVVIPEDQNTSPGGCAKDLWHYQSADCAQPTESDVKLLAASGYSNAQDPEEAGITSIKLIERRFSSYQTPDGFAFDVADTTNGMVATVTYAGATYDGETCWDLNGDASCALAGSDQVEDLNGDNVCDALDCHPSAFSGVLLEYPPTLVPETGDFGVLVDSTPTSSGGETPLQELGKKIKLRQREVVDGGEALSLIQIDVIANFDVTPLVPGTVVATFEFTGNQFPPSDFSLRKENVEQDLFIQKNDGVPEPFLVPGLEFVEKAAFSPSGTRVVLSGIEAARPVVVTAEVNPVDSATRALRKLTTDPTAAESLQWVSVDRSFPCNWIGAHRNWQSKMYVHGFRGGLDEVKVYSYARDGGAILSEAQRGHERLENEIAAGKTSAPKSSSPACNSNFECPAYQLCESGRCVKKNCTSDADCGDGEGRCVLAASVGVPGGTEDEYVCSAECATDAQCFEQQCLNGPCRFCMENTCGECRVVMKSVGTGLTVREVEGCPDRNSFDCVAGSCVTECYSFENGESQYLCDPALEYCHQGRCRLIDWNWSDLSPATFSGVNEMVQGIPFTGAAMESGGMAHRTTAISQTYAINIRAYGSGDYLEPPRILVQGKVDHNSGASGYGNSRLYGGGWVNIGEIVVYATKSGDGTYRLTTPLPLSHLRVSLVNPPMWNMNLGSTGRGNTGGDDAYCVSSPGSSVMPRICDKRAVGSRTMFGYDVGMAPSDYVCAVNASCANHDGVANDRDYLLPGNHAVIVESVEVEGNLLPSVVGGGIALSHRACSYEGSWYPVDDATGRRRKLWFGDPRDAVANETAGSTISSAAATWLDTRKAAGAPLLTLGAPDVNGSPGDGLLFLNCSYAPSGGVPAGLEWAGLPPEFYTHPDYVQSVTNVGGITENGSGCSVENGTPIPDDCFEWAGDANMDVMIYDVQLYQTLELQEFTSFGYDQ